MVGHGHIKDPDGSTLMASDIVVNADTRIKYWGPNSCHNMVHKEMKEDQVDGVTNVLKEVVMTATKLGGQQEEGCGAVLTKS